jgi:integrase/recombinase XerD
MRTVRETQVGTAGNPGGGLGREAVARLQPYSDYLEERRQGRRSANTLRVSTFAFGHLETFLRAAGKTIRDTTPDDLDRFQRCLSERGLATTTADQVLRQVRRLFRWLEKSQRIFMDPTTLWKPPKLDRPLMSVPTEKQVAALLAQPDATRPRGVRDRALIETAYSTGARLEELCRLTIHDADLDRGLLRVMGKGSKERTLPLGKQAVHWLRIYIRDARPKLIGNRPDPSGLWPGLEGRPLDGSSVRSMLGQYGRAAKLPAISPHALRRACATHMLRRGAHPVQIQLLLGHANLANLGQYLRLTIRDLKTMHRQSKVGH